MEKRHTLYLCFIAILLLSCSRSMIETERPETELLPPFSLTQAEAQSNLESFLEAVSVHTKDGVETRTIENGFLLRRNTKSAEEITPPVYVFNFADEKGFALVGGDIRIPDVLCIVDEGNLPEGEIITDPGADMLLANIDTYCRMKMGLPIIDSEGVIHYPEEYGFIEEEGVVKSMNDFTPIIDVVGEHGSIIDCTWRQSSPFNAECYTYDGQQALVGCVPLAVGQIMYYWGKNYTYEGRYYNWQQMRNVKKNNSCPTDTAAWSGVQHLLATLGNPDNINANYGVNSTGAYLDGVPNTFENFGYYSGGEFEDYNAINIYSYVEDGPIMMAGFDHRYVEIDEDGNPVEIISHFGGHAWVIDQVLEVDVYPRPGFIAQRRIYCHCNWGWGGYRDGYFLTGVFDSNNPTQIEINNGTLSWSPQPVTKNQIIIEGTNYYYQYALQMNCGIRANTPLFGE